MSLFTRSILRITSQRFGSTMGSNSQGTQDDPSLTANFIPDFTFPQGLQGDISDGVGNDAICQLWLQKCKLYGYDDCEGRLQKMFNSNSIQKE